MRPGVVFTAACLLVLGVIGLVVLLNNGQPEFVEEPVPATITTLPPIEAVSYDVAYVSVAPDGSLWAATDGGIVRWDLATRTPTVYSTEDGLPTDVLPCRRRSGRECVGGGPDRLPVSMAPGPSSRHRGMRGRWPSGRTERVGTLGDRDLARFDGSEWQQIVSLVARPVASWTDSLDIAPDGPSWPESRTIEESLRSTVPTGPTTRRPTASPRRSDGRSPLPLMEPSRPGSVQDRTPGGGVAHFDGSTSTDFTTEHGLLSDNATVAVGADGTVWAVHQTGCPASTVGPGRRSPKSSGTASGPPWTPPGRCGCRPGRRSNRLRRHRYHPLRSARQRDTFPHYHHGRSGRYIKSDPGDHPSKAAPLAASCPPGTDSNAPGPVDQQRPEDGWSGNLAAAFDQHTGRIVYVDTLGETWTFDVCTNTWHRMNSTGAMIGELSAGLVYDVNSDRTVALGWEHISVYDANTNTWTQPSNDTIGIGDGLIVPMGAVYDPISGLIITTDLTDSYLETWAYDVDTNTWMLIGRLWNNRDRTTPGSNSSDTHKRPTA